MQAERINARERLSKAWYIGQGKMNFGHGKSVKSKEEGKDQESIQSSTSPDQGHHMGK